MRAFIRFSSSAPTGAVVKKELLNASEPIKKLKIDGVNLGAPQGCQLAVVGCDVCCSIRLLLQGFWFVTYFLMTHYHYHFTSWEEWSESYPTTVGCCNLNTDPNTKTNESHAKILDRFVREEDVPAPTSEHRHRWTLRLSVLTASLKFTKRATLYGWVSLVGPLSHNLWKSMFTHLKPIVADSPIHWNFSNVSASHPMSVWYLSKWFCCLQVSR